MAIDRPRIRFAAIFSLALVVALYVTYKFASPGLYFRLLLAPVIIGQGLLYGLLGWAGLAGVVGERALVALTWCAGGLALWYVYYKIVYFLFWLFGLYKPVQLAPANAGEGGIAGAADQDMPPPLEDGWRYRVFLVSLVPVSVVFVLWLQVTSYDAQRSYQSGIVMKAMHAVCDGRSDCDDLMTARFDGCFDAHFVQQGRKWLRARYVVDREPFRACIYASGADDPA